MKTALITWNERIAPVFDTAAEAVIIDFAQGAIISQEVLCLPVDNPLDKVNFLVGAGVSVIICGAISNIFRSQALANGLLVYAFIAGDIEAVIEAWLDNRLDWDAYALPGCGRRQRRGRGRGHGRGRGRGNNVDDSSAYQ